MATENMVLQSHNISDLHDAPKSLQSNSPNLDTTSATSVSAAFPPGAHAVHPNLVFSSSDSVLFHVNTDILTENSAFCDFIPTSTKKQPNDVVQIPEPSSVLDAILHIIYKRPLSDQQPSFATLVSAVEQMPSYLPDPAAHVVPTNPCYAQFLSFAPLFPLETYTLAAHFDMPDLAAAASYHLITYPLSTISDATAERMGPIYLKRLLCLHANRFHELKRLLLAPPRQHTPTPQCGAETHEDFACAWTFAAADLVWAMRSDIFESTIRDAFRSLEEETTCSRCTDALETRLKDVVTRWESISRTI